MFSASVISLVLLLASDTPADAKQLAQDILNKGSSLFDARDAGALAATFAEDATTTLVGKEEAGGPVKTQVIAGRDAIRKAYGEAFRWREPGTISRNLVEFARLVGEDMLIIQGTFTVDTRDPKSAVPFVQIRTRRGDRWLVLSMQLLIEKPGGAGEVDQADCVVD